MIVQKLGVVEHYMRKLTTNSVTMDRAKAARFSNFCRKQNYRTVIGPQWSSKVSDFSFEKWWKCSSGNVDISFGNTNFCVKLYLLC